MTMELLDQDAAVVDAFRRQGRHEKNRAEVRSLRACERIIEEFSDVRQLKEGFVA